MGFGLCDSRRRGGPPRARQQASGRRSHMFLDARASPLPRSGPACRHRRSFPSWFRMAENASRFYPDPAPLGRYSGGRRAAGPAGGWGPAAVARRRTQNSSIFIIVDKCTAPLRSSRPFRRRAVGRGGGWAETIARAPRIVSIKIELSEVSDVYKTKMGSSTVHAEESRYRRHPECLPLGTRTANMEQHKHAERSEPELPPGALALAPRPPI